MFKLSQLFLDKYRGKQPEWGFGDLSYFTFKRTYARIMPDGKQEEYFDTCKRVTEGVFSTQKKHCKTNRLPWNAHKAQKTAQEFFRRMWQFKFTPPGRGFWIMGTPMVNKIGSAALNNCGFASTKDINIEFGNSFAWAMDMLMLGVGIGFDTRGAGSLVVKKPAKEEKLYRIPDTREGWVESVRLLINSYQGNEHELAFDYSDIRKKGAPIRGFGGVASGPEPLLELHQSIRKILGALDGEVITSVAIVDLMNFIGKCVVAGNVRRSAELAIGNIDDASYVKMKDYTLYADELMDRRWASNNSVFADTFSDFSKVAPNIALNGEPGLIFLNNARHFGRLKDGFHGFESDNYDNVDGFNPCKPERSLILTNKGYITFGQAISANKELIVMRPGGGYAEASSPFKTGEGRSVWRVKLSNGTFLYGTENHKHRLANGKWTRMDELSIGDVFNRNLTPVYKDIRSIYNQYDYELGKLAGWTHGDGSLLQRSDGPGLSLQLCFGDQEYDVAEYFADYLGQRLFDHPQSEKCKLVFSRSKGNYENLIEAGYDLDKENITWMYGKSKEMKLGFLRALFTADGSVRESRDAVELYSTRRPALEVVSNILCEFGVPSTITKHSNKKSYIAKDGKVRNNADCHKIVVKAGDFLDIGFISKVKTDKLYSCKLEKLGRMRDKLKVVEIERDYSTEDVYDITVYNEEHAFVDSGVTTHNCAEQSLEDKELCCLVETYPANHEDASDYLTTLKFAYMYAKTVTLIPTHDPRTNSVMMRNRRIGCSMSGIQQAIKRWGLANFLHEFCDSGYEEIKKWDRIYSKWLGIPRSIKMTTVKPSGTVSLLAGATPGVHCTHSEYYLRTVRIAGNSPLLAYLIEAGYRLEPSVTDRKLLERALKETGYLDSVDSGLETICQDFENGEIQDSALLYSFGQLGGTVVAYFPVREKNFTKSKFEISLWEQLALVREMQHYWSDNAVSCTVTVRENERNDLERAIEFFAPYVKTLSFLPLTNHRYAQAPYQEISKEAYEEYAASLKTLDLSDSSESNIKGSKFCTTDKCEV